MQTWLITVFSLPVATTTGRLVLLVSSGLVHSPLRALGLVAAVPGVVAAWRALLHLRRRRTLRSGSIS